MNKNPLEISKFIESEIHKLHIVPNTVTTMEQLKQYSKKKLLLPDLKENEDALNQSNQNERLDRYCCSKNQHSRTINKTWFNNSLTLFKTKYRQQRQQKHNHCQQHQKPYQQHQQQQQQQCWLLLTIIVLFTIIEHSVSLAKADDDIVHHHHHHPNHNDFKITATTIALLQNEDDNSNNSTIRTTQLPATTTSSYSTTTTIVPSSPIITINNETLLETNNQSNNWLLLNTTRIHKKFKSKLNTEDSIFLRFAKRFTGDNNLWSGIIQDCYRKPTFSCFQKNVYYYLNDVLESQDVNVTQRLKFYKNQNLYQYEAEEADEEELKENQLQQNKPTQSSLAKDSMEDAAAENVEENEIPYTGRSFMASTTETPIEEVTNALYGKSIKFAMTHDIELKLPEMMFDGATFRISPQAIEGNGVIAKLELIPKQQNEARLAGKILMKKLQKLMKSKLLLSFLALVLIIKIIKIKLFWLLPLIIGVGAAKKLLLKFLLFLFPALSHLFKLCSYYQQTFHSTKYHHHHHHINHHHTVVPPWHSGESPNIPEIIYTHPPKGHVSAYLHGAPIHEHYGPPSHENFETGWANSGPGLGSEYISDINRVAHVDDKNNIFKPHSNNDANELHAWGLGTTPLSNAPQKRPLGSQQQHQQQQNQRLSTTLQKPPLQQQPQNYQKPQATSQTFNPFKQGGQQSFYNNKYRNNVPAQSAPSPVYTPARQPPPGPQQQQTQLRPQQIQAAISQAAQIAAQYDATRNQQQQQPQQQTGGQIQSTQQQLTPELSAQLKEAIRIQAEQRIVQQQQQILDKQPFVQDGQPLMPLNYDSFYSPILLKIDKIVEQLGVTDDLCKERLVCSMYKDPQRYSPHSNFVSAELSRDTNELQPITNTNQAVIRFFRLIQAARDGQDQKDCLVLYPNCNINTE